MEIEAHANNISAAETSQHLLQFLLKAYQNSFCIDDVA